MPILNPGNVITTDTRQQVKVERLLSEGGQGQAFLATELGSAQKGVLKIFKSEYSDNETKERIRYLVSLNLHQVCQTLYTPVYAVTRNPDHIGHFTKFAEGLPGSVAFGSPAWDLFGNIELGITLSNAMSVLASHGLSHGDIHEQNIIIRHQPGDQPELFVIDFDNYSSPNAPPPRLCGHLHYMSPEVRQAFLRGMPIHTDPLSDLYSMAVLLHDILLWRHPAAGHDPDNETQAFNEAMLSGRWLFDPIHGHPAGIGGYPSAALGPGCARLFRRSLSLDRNRRANAAEWLDILAQAIHEVCLCPSCGLDFVTGPAVMKCPHSACGNPFPHLNLVLPWGNRIPLVSHVTEIGRDQLRSESVSRRHARFTRKGPSYSLECFGLNKSFRWTGAHWFEIPKSTPVFVAADDMIRFADVDCRLVK